MARPSGTLSATAGPPSASTGPGTAASWNARSSLWTRRRSTPPGNELTRTDAGAGPGRRSRLLRFWRQPVRPGGKISSRLIPAVVEIAEGLCFPVAQYRIVVQVILTKDGFLESTPHPGPELRGKSLEMGRELAQDPGNVVVPAHRVITGAASLDDGQAVLVGPLQLVASVRVTRGDPQPDHCVRDRDHPVGREDAERAGRLDRFFAQQEVELGVHFESDRLDAVPDNILGRITGK